MIENICGINSNLICSRIYFRIPISEFKIDFRTRTDFNLLPIILVQSNSNFCYITNICFYTTINDEKILIIEIFLECRN